jgi:signal recognition particle receptor subunit beta
MNSLIKLVISGTMGAGKTSAIEAISGIPPIRTDVAISDGESLRPGKTTTTVAMDYGELALDEDQVLVIFGTPGQERYDFMCKILVKGALGMLLLIDLSAEDPERDLTYYLSLYESQLHNTPCVIGLTHEDLVRNFNATRIYEIIKGFGLNLPVILLDARSVADVTTAIEILLAQAEEFEIREAVA